MMLMVFALILMGCFLIFLSIFIFLQRRPQKPSLSKQKRNSKTTNDNPSLSNLSHGDVDGLVKPTSLTQGYVVQPAQKKTISPDHPLAPNHRIHHEENHSIKEKTLRSSSPNENLCCPTNQENISKSGISDSPIQTSLAKISVSSNDAHFALDKKSEAKDYVPIGEEHEYLFRGSCLLYEDGSGKLIYDGTDIEVDETLNGYEKFQRIGEGIIQLIDRCITFDNDALHFDFPFEEIKNLIFYQNCVVLIPRKEKVIRIFFPEDYQGFRLVCKQALAKLKTDQWRP